jgi:hypothetical protein
MLAKTGSADNAVVLMPMPSVSVIVLAEGPELRDGKLTVRLITAFDNSDCADATKLENNKAIV